MLGAIIASVFLFKDSRSKNIEQMPTAAQNAYFEPFRITDFFSKIPYIEVNIGDQVILLKFDLGFDGELSLPASLLKSIEDKSFIQQISYMGMRGKKYLSDLYLLPRIKIGRIGFCKAKAQENNLEFERDTVLYADPSIEGKAFPASASKPGSIGWKLFQPFNLFLDCNHSIVALCDSMETLAKRGYSIQAFHETPLLIDRNLIEFNMITENGPLRCLLDTGATLNFINTHRTKHLPNVAQKLGSLCQKTDSSSCFGITPESQYDLNPENCDLLKINPRETTTFTTFKLGNKDFGPIEFQHIDTPVDIDLILGMEFIASKLIFIDFSHLKIYCSDKLIFETVDLDYDYTERYSKVGFGQSRRSSFGGGEAGHVQAHGRWSRLQKWRCGRSRKPTFE